MLVWVFSASGVPSAYRIADPLGGLALSFSFHHSLLSLFLSPLHVIQFRFSTKHNSPNHYYYAVLLLLHPGSLNPNGKHHIFLNL